MSISVSNHFYRRYLQRVLGVEERDLEKYSAEAEKYIYGRNNMKLWVSKGRLTSPTLKRRRWKGKRTLKRAYIRHFYILDIMANEFIKLKKGRNNNGI